MSESPAPAPSADDYRPFRSLRGRRVALTIGVLQFILLTVVGLNLPAPFGAVEAAEMIGVAAIVGFVLWRFATISAVPSPQGLVVRNFARTTRLDWAEIVSVRMGGGNPWATLDLSDTDTLSVMAIQRADGEAGLAQAKRLARLVEQHSDPERSR